MDKTIKQRIVSVRNGKVPAGYKQTKLGVIPHDWNLSPLNAYLVENKARNRQGKYSKDNVLSVSGDFGIVNQIDLLGRSFAGVSVLDYHIVEHGNIVYTKSPLKSNPYGIIKINKGEAGIVSTLYAVYTCKDYPTGLYLDYYFSNDYLVNNYLRPLVRKGTKNDMKINNEDALKADIIMPSSVEIKKIVKILGCCDKVISLKKELIAEKKKQKKALMQKLLDPQSGFRLPGFSGKWKPYKISQVAKVESGGTPATNTARYWNGNILWCTPTDISLSSKYIDVTSESISQDGLKNSSACILPLGTIIMCSRASIGPKAITVKPMTTNQGFKNFICSHLLNNEFWYYFLEIILPDFKKMASGNTFKEISKKAIDNYSVIIPCYKEQQAIANILSGADKEIDLLEQELAEWEKKKKALMQLLLTGIVRVGI